MQRICISGTGFPPYIRGECRQQLQTIGLGAWQRTVNGQLLYTGTAQSTKYLMELSGEDSQAPPFSHLPCGAVLRINAQHLLWQPLYTPQGQRLPRPAFEENVIVVDRANQEVPAQYDPETQQVRVRDPSRIEETSLPAEHQDHVSEGSNAYASPSQDGKTGLSSCVPLLVGYRPVFDMALEHMTVEWPAGHLTCRWQLQCAEI